MHETTSLGAGHPENTPGIGAATHYTSVNNLHIASIDSKLSSIITDSCSRENRTQIQCHSERNGSNAMDSVALPALNSGRDAVGARMVAGWQRGVQHV